MLIEDPETCYRAVSSRDRRFDGLFYTAVLTTGIYCRPSCPASTPRRRNVRFFRTAGAAQLAGFRACKRCRPDATPGSPEWDVAADTAGRAMRLISDGVVEREGVEGLASRVGYSARHLTRVLSREVGAGPLALARARRAQTARTLIESTTMPFADVAFAAGFASIRQFNDTVHRVYATSPTRLRARAVPHAADTAELALRLAVRRPFAGSELLRFLAARAVTGVEEVDGATYTRTLRLPHGDGSVSVVLDAAEAGYVPCRLRLGDLRDLTAAVERVRRLLDADGDPVAIEDQLAADPVLGGTVRRQPGLRVPGHVDGVEVAVRAVLGQQVSVARARSLVALVVERYGEPATAGAGRLFPSAEALAAADADDLPVPRTRAAALVGLCEALASGELRLDRSRPRAEVRRALLAVPGIGPWTVGYISLRALGDPDVFLPMDVGTRHGLARVGVDARRGEDVSQAWRPWRSYAQMHLWTLAARSATTPDHRAGAGRDERT